MDSPGWIKIWSFSYVGDMYAIRSKLELEGVKVITKNENLSNVYGVGRLGTDGIQLYVHIDEYTKAAKIMNDFDLVVPSFVNKEEYYKSLDRKATLDEQQILKWGVRIFFAVVLLVVLVFLLT